MGVLLSGPHELAFEHRRVSDSFVKKTCVYRLDRKASRVILSEAITLLAGLDLLKSFMAQHSYGELW